MSVNLLFQHRFYNKQRLAYLQLVALQFEVNCYIVTFHYNSVSSYDVNQWFGSWI